MEQSATDNIPSETTQPDIEEQQIQKHEIPKQQKSSKSPKKCQIFLWILTGMLILAFISGIGVLYYLQKIKFQHNMVETSTIQMLVEDYHKWKTKKIIDLNPNCKYAEKLRKKGFKVVCGESNREPGQWVEYLQMELQGLSDQEIQKITKNMADWAEKGIILSWKDLNYNKNKKIAKQINETLEKSGFEIDEQEIEYISGKLEGMYTNNIYVFKKKVQSSSSGPTLSKKDLSLAKQAQKNVQTVKDRQKQKSKENIKNQVNKKPEIVKIQEKAEKKQQTLNPYSKASESPKSPKSPESSSSTIIPELPQNSIPNQSPQSPTDSKSSLPQTPSTIQQPKTPTNPSSQPLNPQTQTSQIPTRTRKPPTTVNNTHVLYSKQNGAFEGKGRSLEMNHFYTKRVLNVLLDLYPLKGVKSVVDFGGGLCTYAEKLQLAGYEVQCYDGNSFTPNITKFGKYLDLTVPQYLGKQFDWVQSFEVGEHIPADKSDTYVDLLTKHARKGVIMSWAIPRQMGFGHINERANVDVIKMLYERGFHLNESLTIKYRKVSIYWFQTNILVFQKNTDPVTPTPTPTSAPANYSQISQRVQIRRVNNVVISIKSAIAMSSLNQISLLIDTNKDVQFKDATEMTNALVVDFPKPIRYAPPDNIECIQDPASLKDYRCVLEYGQKALPKIIEILVSFFYGEYYGLRSFNVKPQEQKK